MEGVVIDTNVFVAAGFNAKSASARILAATLERRFQLVWNEPTRRETEFVLRRIPPLRWGKFADLFRPEGEFTCRVDPHDFAFIEDPDDRKFAIGHGAARDGTARPNGIFYKGKKWPGGALGLPPPGKRPEFKFGGNVWGLAAILIGNCRGWVGSESTHRSRERDGEGFKRRFTRKAIH
jgi:hypothetical protein